MKLAQRLMISLALVVAVFAAGCEQQQAQPAAQQPVAQPEVSQADQLAAETSAAIQEIQSSLERLQNQNEDLRFTINRQESIIEELTGQLESINESATRVRQDIAAARTAATQTPAETQQQEGTGVGGLLLLILLILVILILAVVIWNFVKPKPFEEDDEEDFSTFDDDFGFEDEEEDFGDEEEEEAGEEEKK